MNIQITRSRLQFLSMLDVNCLTIVLLEIRIYKCVLNKVSTMLNLEWQPFVSAVEYFLMLSSYDYMIGHTVLKYV